MTPASYSPDATVSVRCATIEDITLSGLQTIDDITLVKGDRVLVKSQSDAAQNGVYEAFADEWKRAKDARNSRLVTSGLATYVSEGTEAGHKIWTLTTIDPIVVGETELVFENLIPLPTEAFSTMVEHLWGANQLIDSGYHFQDSVLPTGDSDLTNKLYVDNSISDVTGLIPQVGDYHVWTATNEFNGLVKFNDTNVQLNGSLLQAQPNVSGSVWASSRIVGDSAESFFIYGDGKIGWSDGADSPDLFLERNANNQMTLSSTGSFMELNLPLGVLNFVTDPGSTILKGSVSGDATDHFRLNEAGQLTWGNGTDALDTNLYRSDVSELTTDGNLKIGGTPTDPTDAATVQYVADNSVSLSGSNVWLGTNEFQGAVNIDSGGYVFITGTGPGSIFQTARDTDAGHRLEMNRDGKLNWGDGTASPDTNLYRSGAGVLRTDNGFVVGSDAHIIGSLQIDGNSILGNAATDYIGMFGATSVQQAAAIPNASGGVVIDVEARSAINALLAASRAGTGLGFIAA